MPNRAMTSAFSPSSFSLSVIRRPSPSVFVRDSVTVAVRRSLVLFYIRIPRPHSLLSTDPLCFMSPFVSFSRQSSLYVTIPIGWRRPLSHFVTICHPLSVFATHSLSFSPHSLSHPLPFSLSLSLSQRSSFLSLSSLRNRSGCPLGPTKLRVSKGDRGPRVIKSD